MLYVLTTDIKGYVTTQLFMCFLCDVTTSCFLFACDFKFKIAPSVNLKMQVYSCLQLDVWLISIGYLVSYYQGDVGTVSWRYQTGFRSGGYPAT